MPCGLKFEDEEYRYYDLLKEMKGKIYVSCDKKECGNLEIIEEKGICKPENIFYNRIYSIKDDEKIL